MKRSPTHPWIVRNLEEEVVRKLRLREAEYREILRQALLPGKGQKSLKELLLAIPPVGEDADFERSPDHGRDVEL